MGLTPKQLRRQVIRSLSLRTIAAEVNRQRLDVLREKIRTASSAQRKKMRRLTRLYATGRLETVDDLPSDLRADARRMQRTLTALHLAMGDAFVVTRSVAVMAESAGMTAETLRRGILDLEQGRLLLVRRRDRPRRSGGQGVSEYRLVLATLRDLAWSQGLQGELFDCGRPGQGHDDSVAESFGNSSVPSGQNHPSGASVAGGRAPTHGGRAPTHGGRAPTHGGRALRPRAGTSLAESFSPTSSSSSSPPEESQPAQREKETTEEFELLTAVSRRLKMYGVADHHDLVMHQDPEAGWSADQMCDFVDDLERETIDGVAKWSPGAVWWQLKRGAPGSRITLPPTDAWLRARRDRDRRLERDCEARRAAEQRPQREAEETAWRQREERLGPILDSLSPDDLRRLAEQTNNSFLVAGGRQKWLTTFRRQLLESLEHSDILEVQDG